MKRLLLLLLPASALAQTANVGIGTMQPDSSALLHIESTDRGVLIPRLTAAQRIAVSAPANGLLVYDTDTACFYFYNALLPAWQNLCAGGAAADGQAWRITGNSGTDTAQHFLGTMDDMPLSIRVNNIRSGLLDHNERNVFLGHRTGLTNTGQGHVFIGHEAGMNQTYTSGNVAIGAGALHSNNHGVNLVAIGNNALYHNFNDVSPTILNYASNNTAVGSGAMYSNVSGSLNCAIGTGALYSNTTGGGNTAVGWMSLSSTVTSSGNTAVGDGALTSSVSGENNSAVGAVALSDNISGSSNTALGVRALSYAQGSRNVAVGLSALDEVFRDIGTDLEPAGANNTAVGYRAGYHLQTITHQLTNNTLIGYEAGVGTLPFSNITACTHVGANVRPADTSAYVNQTLLGQNTVGTASNQVRIGSVAVTSIGGFAGWTNVSDGRFKRNVEEDVPGLALIGRLRPVSYTLDVEAVNHHLGVPDSLADHAAVQQKSALRMTGLVAQEVEQAARELGYPLSAVDAPKGEKDIYGLRYAELVPSLIRAVQEQQETIARLELRLGELEQR